MIGNQNGMEKVEAGGKGEHSYYKQKGSALRGAEETVIGGGDCNVVEETVMRWRSDKGSGRLQKGFYRGTGFCGVTGL